jgi:hypothetical protein
MAFLVVPHEVTDTTATVWVGSLGEGDASRKTVALDVEAEGADTPFQVELDACAWRTWRTFDEDDPERYPWLDLILHRATDQVTAVVKTLYFQRVTVRRLSARTTYSLRLLVNDSTTCEESHLREASVTTLPAALPRQNEKPFTLLLGSCFYKPGDFDGMVGKTYRCIPDEEKPDIKVLCGDQVYLDNPWYETTLKWYRGNKKPGSFREMLLNKYWDTWTHAPSEGAGFRQLLRHGANYFCSDDHEFWNNAPYFGGVGLANTVTRGQRQWWFKEAGRLFRTFQSPSSLLKLEVPPLSICVADTRINRDTYGERFMRRQDLEAVKQWISRLKGPGVLVVGQPLLASQSCEGISSAMMSRLDKDLADFAAYGELMKSVEQLMENSPHSLVMLTGDVHFARVAYLWPKLNGTTRLVEVVSSPMSLVAAPWGGRQTSGYRAAQPLDSETIFSGSPFGNQHKDHFATIGFSQAEDGNVRMEITYWPILLFDQDPTPDSPKKFEFTLA